MTNLDPDLIREYAIRTCPSVNALSRALNAACRDGWILFSVVPSGRLFLLVVFRLIPKPAARRVG